MDTFRLVYCSRAVESQKLSDLMAIMMASKVRNERAGITGMLCYSSRCFFQCMEGPQVAICETFGRISRDPRHTGLLIADARFVSARLFPEWVMEVIPAEQVPGDLVGSVFGASDKTYGQGRLQTERLLNFLEQVSAGLGVPPGAPPAPRPGPPRAGSGLLSVPPARPRSDRR